MSSIDEFLTYLQVARQVSAHTLDAYRRDLAALVAWAAEQKTDDGMQDAAVPGDTAQFDSAHLRQFVAAEHRRGLSPKSLQRRLSACRSYYAWLLKHGRISASPAAALRAPKAPRKLPQVLDADEAVRLVEVPTDAPLGLRDRALLEVFYSSGLRLGELCALRWRDLDLDSGLVMVLGKGSKQRLVPVGSHAIAALREWRRDSGASADTHVFLAVPAVRFRNAQCRSASSNWPYARACSRMCTRICCATVSLAISWNRPAICAACRSCWGIRISPLPRSTRIWISSTWPRSTMPRIRGPGARRLQSKC